MRAIPLALLLASPAFAMDVAPISAIEVPLSPPPAVLQLRLDVAALSAPTSLALPPAAALNPAAWTNIQAAIAAAPAAAAAPGLALPAAAAAPGLAAAAAPNVAAAAPLPGAAPIETDAVKRLQVAQQILGRYDPAEFAKLPADQRDAALNELWDGWSRRGLVAEPGPRGEDLRRLDRTILDGVDDKALTRSNKSIFLGVGVLGYPLEEAVWLSRTRIGDALEENKLTYPSGQRWRNESGTPEFLGVGDRAQGLVDAWGAATEAAKEIARQVELGSHELPESTAVSRDAAAGFARVVAELLAGGDKEAVDYMTGQDPTFTAFMLDARKPGYYLYNGDKSVVARILRTRAAAALGIRRVDHPLDGTDHASTYLYRPARVVESLRAAAREPAPKDAEAERAALGAYAERLAPLVAAAPTPAASQAPYTFSAPEFLPGAALQSAANQLPAGLRGGTRYDLPFPLSSLRPRLASGDRYGQFTQERWEAFGLLEKSIPALANASGETVVRFVGEPFQTRGRRIASMADGKGVIIQFSVLDDVARLRDDPAGLARELRFLTAAFAAALR
jgi:hypothetical protein